MGDEECTEVDWMRYMRVEVMKAGVHKSATSSICRVPRKLRKVNPEAYRPRAISIGPLHHGDTNLQAMEYHKLRYTQSFLARNIGIDLETCLAEMLRLADAVRLCYAETIRIATNKELAEMMLRDACFLIELFLKYCEGNVAGDPIFDNSLVLANVRHDLVLLENQIPFFLLERLFLIVVVPAYRGARPIFTFAHYFFKSVFGFNDRDESEQEWNHLLHFLYTCYVPSSTSKPSGNKRSIPCATALTEAGIMFEHSSNDLSEAKFSNRVLHIPPLHVNDSTDFLLRNLIAYEQCWHDSHHIITSYVFLVDALVSSAQDAQVLVDKGIIRNELSEVDRISKLFHSLCKQVVLKDFSYATLFEQVEAGYNSESAIKCECKSSKELGRKYEYKIWIRSMAKEMSKAPTTGTLTSSSIYRVPSKLREVNADAYTPHLISVGPLHHAHDTLQPMEQHKLRYAVLLLQRSAPNNEEILENCGKEMLKLVERVRTCYAETIRHTDYELAKIMLLDACFIVELFLRCHNKTLSDPVFDNPRMVLALQRDLTLLENQLPFFVLESLFNMIMDGNGNDLAPLHSVASLALGFFESTLNMRKGSLRDRGGSYKHLLDLLLGCYLDAKPRVDDANTNVKGAASVIIHPVTALAEAGIQFKKASSDRSLLDVSFDDGIFEIPSLCIHDSTDSLFRNFIAFEQCCPANNGNLFTAHMVLMDRLIDCENDVKLLEEANIIENNLGVREDVSKLFNDICKQVVYDDHYLTDLCTRVDQRYNASFRRLMASFKRTYCVTPWTCISLLAGTVLLIFTAFQTVYSGLSYYHQ